MTNSRQTIDSDKEQIAAITVRILGDMTNDWETGFDGSIGLETRLVADLDLTSMDIVHLAIALEEQFGCSGLPFQQLMTTADGRYVDELRVSELVDFLVTHLKDASLRKIDNG